MNNLAKDVFFFESMLTPKLITFLYWLMLLGIVVGGIYVMFLPFFGGFLKGLAIIIVGVIAVRIWCELLIVIFKINENAHRIAEATPRPPAPVQPKRDDNRGGLRVESGA
ncbi:MAG: DUF4282 domain-containing protein [Gammaproteobacteria bacterium]